MKRSCIIWIFFVSMLLLTINAAFAVNYSFKALEFPGALATYATDINDSGAITGYYERTPDDEYDRRFHLGFLLKGSTWTTLDLSEMRQSTFPYGINNHDWIVGGQIRNDEYGFTWGFGHGGLYLCPGYDGHVTRFYDVNDAGIIIGACGTSYWGDGSRWAGFTFDGTSYNMFTTPDGSHPIPVNINNQGMIIATSENRSYYINRDIWHTLSYPGATNTGATAINNLNIVVGQYTDSAGKTHAFRFNGTNWVSGDYPGATETIAYDINDKGLIVGSYKDADGKRHGFSYINGVWSSLDYPGATDTYARLVNNNGLIVGSFTKDGQEGQFLAIPLSTMAIDIRPWNSSNLINRRDWGLLPVAILSNSEFDAVNIMDLDTITFGPTGDENSLAFCSPIEWDVNRDSYKDLVCFFWIQRMGFQCGDTQGVLKGTTQGGIHVEAKDSVRVIPCK